MPAEALAEIDARFGALPRPWLVLGLGASHPDKDWPDEQWCALLQEIARNSQGATFIIGGPSLQARADRVIAAAGVGAFNACDLPIMKSAALCKRADLFVGADSGALNLAAAVGTTAYGLFGLTPALDYSRHIHIIRTGDHPGPMREITAQRVHSTISAALKDRQPPR